MGSWGLSNPAAQGPHLRKYVPMGLGAVLPLPHRNNKIKYITYAVNKHSQYKKIHNDPESYKLTFLPLLILPR